MTASYDFAQYLSQVPAYKRKADSLLQTQATTDANLVFDPQKQEEQRQMQYNEAQHINNMQQLKASQAGVDDTLAFNAAQAQKANAIRAAGSGAIGASGLGDFLNQQTEQALQGQKLNIAATQG